MATHARQQYFADEHSLSKENREFSIADDIQQKIDSIEPGAQVNKIETVKVNGTALVPDANKAVNVEVPEVIDNLYTVDPDNALSAKQGKLLYDYIQNIASRGRFLSNWNSATGLPMTNPSESPYQYKSGDYFVVSNVAGSGGTNYRPNGSSYIIGQASTVTETEDVSVSDFYFYDGSNWLLLSNSGRQIAIDTSLSTTSTNPVENRVITNALNGKQETLIAGSNIQIAADGKTISATDTTYSAGANISIDANNEISAVDTTYTAGTGINIDANNEISCTVTPGATYTAGNGIDIDSNNEISVDTTVVATQTDLAGKQDTLTAGTNIQINGSTISATDTTYTAGKGIVIKGGDDYSAMRGPSPEGYHIPRRADFLRFINGLQTFGLLSGDVKTAIGTYLKLPYAGYRTIQGSANGQGTTLNYHLCDIYFNRAPYYVFASTNSNSINIYDRPRLCEGGSIRPFKDEPVIPDNTWTTLYDGSSTATGAGIFYSATLGLISISTDGTTWTTMADKNLGATTVYNYGNTLSEANCGKYYQRGNNYGFPRTGNVTTSSTQVDTTGYGPGNYYSSDTFILGSGNRFNPSNLDLRGGVTGVVHYNNNTIINTGVTSVNGQTGDITIQTGGNYSAGTGINISNQNVISADTTVVATQTDVNNKVSKGTNQISGQLFSIEDTYGNSANFGPDYIRIDFDDGTDSGSAGFQRGSLGASANGKMSNLTSDTLALRDDSNLTQTIYAESGISVIDSGYGNLEAFEFAGGGNNQIARLKDVKTYTAGSGINIDANNQISNTLPGPTIAATAPTGTEGALWYDTTNDVLMAHDGTVWKEAGTQMKVLSYGHSTRQDFIDAYNENAIVYCKASSGSNPGSGVQGRMAFMAFVEINSSTQVVQSVEFQYYRSRSDHNSAANQLDQVFVYKLTSAGTWTVTERNTAAKAVAGTGINLGRGSGNMTISADTTTLATQTDLSGKQDTLVSGTNIKTVNNESLLGSGNITISAPTYTAGENITIDQNNEISAVDTTYTAGPGIEIRNGNDYSALRGPCPDGYHVPTQPEFDDLVTKFLSLGLGRGTFYTYYKVPMAGLAGGDSGYSIKDIGTKAQLVLATAYSDDRTYYAYVTTGYVAANYKLYKGYYGYSLRPFKDVPVAPDSNWTVLYQGTGNAGIYYNATEGLISLSTDGTNWITVADKNLGATTVFNTGDTLSEANCGKFYQWGNNYGFPGVGSDTSGVVTSSTKVDASSYGPSEYSSSTFIITGADWSSVTNNNLWGGVTGIIEYHNAITNIGGDVAVSSESGNILSPGAKIWVGDESDLPNTPDSNTVYLCAEQTSGTPILPAAYQEVEYIESGNGGDTQNIQFYLPYFDSDGHYSLEIDVGNVGNAEGVLFTILQTLAP